MKRFLFVSMIAAVALGVVLALSGCSGGSYSTGSSGGAPAAGATAVTMKDFAFVPASIEVKVGDSVTWTNEDSVTHTVKGDGGLDSGDIAAGQSYSKTFDTAGTYSYACSIHPAMTGTVVVK